MKEYTDKFINLLRKVDPENEYPEEYKIRTYRRGLKPEIRKWIQISADGTFINMVQVVKNVEKADADIPTRGYHQSQTQDNSTLNAILVALQGLNQRIESIETNKGSNYNRNNSGYRSNNQNSKPVSTCYNCGEPGHIRSNCSKLQSYQNNQNNFGNNRQRMNRNNQQQNNVPPNQANVGNNQNANNNQNALLAQIQALTDSIQILTAKPDNVNSLLGTHEYLAAERKSRNSRTTPYGTRPIDRPRKEIVDEIEELNDNEEQEDTPEVILDQDMNNAGPSKTVEEELAKKIIRKKKSKIALPVLTTMAKPYNILEDLAQQKANITVAQLIQTSPSQRTQLSKGMRRATTLKPKRKRRVLLGQKLKTTSAWCEAKVGKNIIDLIIDTSASECVTTHNFIKDLGLKIQRSSNISMSDINSVS